MALQEQSRQAKRHTKRQLTTEFRHKSPRKYDEQSTYGGHSQKAPHDMYSNLNESARKERNKRDSSMVASARDGQSSAPGKPPPSMTSMKQAKAKRQKSEVYGEVELSYFDKRKNNPFTTIDRKRQKI